MTNISTLLKSALAALALAFVGTADAAAQGQPTKIRIGWQPTSTVEAQIAHVLAKTDILEKNGFKAEMIMFSFGPAVNEAIVSGAIDVGFIGDMPSVSLAVANAPSTVIARQSVFRGSIMAAANSSVKTIQDLKGKKLYGPVGSSIYLASLSMLEKAGLKPNKDVEIVHMAFADIADALKANRVDAVFVWDPWVELFASEGLGRVVASDTELTMVVTMRDDFRQKNPDAARRFLKAHKEALLFATSDHARANTWVREPEAARKLDPKVIQAATAYDPQWNAKSLKDIRLSFTDAELQRYLGLGKRAFELKIFPKDPPLSQKTDLTVAKELDATPWDFDPAKVKIVK
jgi:ABC-type nitrate/sulfonate/bicarbonate transport system substrate-binding protein